MLVPLLWLGGIAELIPLITHNPVTTFLQKSIFAASSASEARISRQGDCIQFQLVRHTLARHDATPMPPPVEVYMAWQEK